MFFQAYAQEHEAAQEALSCVAPYLSGTSQMIRSDKDKRRAATYMKKIVKETIRRELIRGLLLGKLLGNRSW